MYLIFITLNDKQVRQRDNLYGNIFYILRRRHSHFIKIFWTVMLCLIWEAEDHWLYQSQWKGRLIELFLSLFKLFLYYNVNGDQKLEAKNFIQIPTEMPRKLKHWCFKPNSSPFSNKICPDTWVIIIECITNNHKNFQSSMISFKEIR